MAIQESSSTTSFQTPPLHPNTKNEEPSSEDEAIDSNLSTRLDSLLTQYLELLDTYTTIRESLSKDLASGFFNLAQANRTSNLGVGRRYGEEGYDERMKASQIVNINTNTTSSHESHIYQTDTDAKAKGGQHEKYTGWLYEIIQPEKSSHEDSDQSKQSPISKENDQAQVSKHLPQSSSSTTNPRNPLNWYGILIPPALRIAQSNFTSAVIGQIPQLLNTVSAMRRLEAKIWAVRKDLEIGHEYLSEQEITDVAVESNAEGTALTVMPHQGSKVQLLEEESRKYIKSSSTPSKSSQRQRLVARPAEPRSRIIKIE